ncbi:DUF1918 domain-containing protein [Skermania sp. ID1734]|uniref:DUF1918 domain-containing protein n=1 Tax=Skermania sp. ID1734 TaxID=2597516 RepID=UPI00117C9D0E|nr:DUF1918 domain-containing protein [Skermania sp. ID1734]TSE02013.1 DUF1918 domain-containing protein [Skermania sp. ID1734]
MKAVVGDKLHVHSATTGRPDQVAEVTEVRGADGAPPYQVRFDDGHQALIFPGSDCSVEHVT